MPIDLQTPQQVPQAPQAPLGAPQQMASPEEMKQLTDLLGATKGKISELNSTGFVANNSGEAERQEGLKEVFAMLEQAGVDLRDPAAVGEFLEQLKSINPEMAQLLEEAIGSLLGEGTAPQESEWSAPLPNPGDMNINNEAIQPNIQQPPQGGVQGGQLLG